MTSFVFGFRSKSRVFDTKHISAIEDDPRGGGGSKNQNENVYENMDKALLEVGMTKSQLMSLSEFDRKALRLALTIVP